MKTHILRTSLIIALFLTISACGNKGDLYLPKKDDDTTTSQKP